MNNSFLVKSFKQVYNDFFNGYIMPGVGRGAEGRCEITGGWF